MGRRSQAGLSDFTGGYDTLAGIGRDDAVERFDSSVLEYIEEGPGGGELPFGDSAEGFRGALALGGGLCGHLLFRRAGVGRPSASEGGYSV